MFICLLLIVNSYIWLYCAQAFKLFSSIMQFTFLYSIVHIHQLMLSALCDTPMRLLFCMGSLLLRHFRSPIVLALILVHWQLYLHLCCSILFEFAKSTSIQWLLWWLNCWIDELLNCWIVELLKNGIVKLLNCWIVDS